MERLALKIRYLMYKYVVPMIIAQLYGKKKKQLSQNKKIFYEKGLLITFFFMKIILYY